MQIHALSFGLFYFFSAIFGLFLPKNSSNEINSPKNAYLTQIFLESFEISHYVFNEIHTNEFRIRRESPVMPLLPLEPALFLKMNIALNPILKNSDCKK